MSEPSPSPSPLPPLRIHHLWAWMTVAAVLISVSMWFDRTAHNGPPIENKLYIAALIVLALCVAGAVTFAGMGLYWRSKRLKFPNDPGEWLTLEIALIAVSFVIWILGSFVAFWIDDDAFTVAQLILGLIALAALLVVNGFAIHGSRTGALLWRVFFVCITFLPVCWLFLVFASAEASVVAIFLPVLLLLSAVASDRKRGVHRTWMHWFGIAFTLGIAAAFAAFSI